MKRPGLPTKDRPRPPATAAAAHVEKMGGPARDEPMPEAVRADGLLARLDSAWADAEFQDSVSMATSMSIQDELLNGSSSAARARDAHAVSLLAQNAAVLSFMTEAASIDAGPAGGLPKEAAGNAHRLAKLWESLSKICKPAAAGAFSLNAACAYELAGYQANARCMARRFESAGGEKAGLEEAASMFLQRRFVQMRSYCRPLMAEPDYEKVEDFGHRLALASAATALSDFAGCLLSGSNPEMDDILGGLGDAERLFHEGGYHGESSLAHSIKSLVGSMWSRSTWSALGGAWANGGGLARSRYLVLLARGLGSPVPSGSSISEVWPSQLEAVRGGLLSSSESKVVRMPTGAGKARIAEMSILHALTAGPPGAARRCVYMAPYRALVSEATRSLSLVFPDLGFSVSGMDGAYDAAPLGAGGGDLPDILVLTPEKLDMIARTSPQSLDGTALFVIDEGHVVNDGTRGARIEVLLTRLRRRFAKSRFILLSSVLSDDAMRRFAAWLRCGGPSAPGGSGIIRAEWRPTSQRIAKFEWAHGTCRLTYEPLGPNLGQRETVDGLFDAGQFQYDDFRTGRRRAKVFPSPAKNEIAAELAFRYSALGPVLVYAAHRDAAMAVALKMRERARLAEGAGRSAPAHFQGSGRRSADVSAEWLGPDHAVTRLLQNGIAVHHGRLPRALRRAIEADAQSGMIRAAVSTGTPSQGVDLPARTIIVHSCKRRDGERGQPARMPDGEYWSLAGRAGRAGHETEGTVIHIVMSPSDAGDFDHYMSVRDKCGDAGGSGLHRLLADLARDRISDDELARAMDPEILGIMAEEGLKGGCVGAVKEVVASSLAAQSLEGGPDVEKACDRIAGRARSIGLDAPESIGMDMLRAYGGTGLGMQSCAALQEHVDKNRDALLRMLAPDGAGSSYELARLIMGALGAVSEMEGNLEYGGDRDALLELWMGGSTAHNALKEAGAEGEDAEGAAMFIGTAFGDYVPWGASAFVRIAAARLGIAEGDLPAHARYLPEMIRHGVPAPEHVWAMRLGIATKSAAMKVCERLRPSTQEELAGLISGMRIEDLAECGMSAGMAADVAGAARRLHPNPLLREGRSLGDVVGAPVRIVATDGARWHAARLAAGDGVEIRRDYGDLADRNAMAAYVAGRHIGHVEGRAAQYLAPLVDAGMSVSARVASSERGGGDAPRVEVVLSVRDGLAQS